MKKRKKYDFSNLGNEQEYENLDTYIIDLTRTAVRIIQSGETDQAWQYVRSDIFQSFLYSLENSPGYYLSMAYQFNCISSYTAALGVLTSYSPAQKLLEKLTYKTYTTPKEYRKAIEETIIAFTALVEKQKSRKLFSRPVSKACAYIEDHIYMKSEPEDLAAYCGCSLSHLRHIFKKETGESLVQYIHKAKTEKAMQMLDGSDYSIAQIGNQLGFCSESHFITVFKKHTGCTPRQYRTRGK